MVELKVSGHLMALDAGLFCIFQPPGAPVADRNGLPGVRVSVAPMGRPDAVRITTFRDDGWLPGGEGAALVQVAQGPAQIMVTVYQAPDAPAEAAPRLQVLRLSAEPAAAAPGPVAPRAAVRAPAAPAAAVPADIEMVAHVQRTGDVGARIGDWLGTRGSKLWIEGFSIAPRGSLPAAAAESLEYQAVLGRDWLSPWVEGGAYCGSRGMALPLLGLAVRLKGEAAQTHECRVTATFVDGTTVGPLSGGEAAQSESLAPLEAVLIDLRPRAPRTPGMLRAPGAAPVAAAPIPAPPAAAAPAKRKTARRTR
ncbi:MAG: hypothetical protein HIU82_05890 [Proteobacteria bacterium]|nr:hypothetical protein [Pseudomonadota bacterium]